MQDNAMPCNTSKYHAIQCNIMQYHAIPYNTMQYHAIPCNTMQYHACLLSADGAYHCPVGSIWPFFELQDQRRMGRVQFCSRASSRVVGYVQKVNEPLCWKIY